MSEIHTKCPYCSRSFLAVDHGDEGATLRAENTRLALIVEAARSYRESEKYGIGDVEIMKLALDVALEAKAALAQGEGEK